MKTLASWGFAPDHTGKLKMIPRSFTPDGEEPASLTKPHLHS